jgi:hypothetical protein
MNRNLILIIAFCILTAGFTADTAAQRSFHPGVKLMAGEEPIDIKVGHLVPAVADWNNDGKKDLITGQFADGKIGLFLNKGTDTSPVLSDIEYLKAGGKEISLPAG